MAAADGFVVGEADDKEEAAAAAQDQPTEEDKAFIDDEAPTEPIDVHYCEGCGKAHPFPVAESVCDLCHLLHCPFEGLQLDHVTHCDAISHPFNCDCFVLCGEWHYRPYNYVVLGYHMLEYDSGAGYLYRKYLFVPKHAPGGAQFTIMFPTASAINYRLLPSIKTS